MAKWFKYLFAESGDKTAIPDTTDPSGYVSYQSGYGADYERVLGTDPLAKAIERQKMNQALNDITGAIQQYQTHGFPDYIDATTNGGTAYAYEIGAVVRFTDDKNYRNTVAGNTDAPDVAGWVLYNDPASAISVATEKTTLVNADMFGIWDSVSGLLRKVSFANLIATISALFAPVSTHGTSVTATGTAVNFTGVIPSWAKKVTVMLVGVSTNGTSPILIQIGDSGGIETSGYLGSASGLTATNVLSAGFTLGISGQEAAGDIEHGLVQIVSFGTSNTYVASGNLGQSDAGRVVQVAGSKTLTDVLTSVRVTTVNGTDTFDAGTINIMWEG